VLDLGRGRENSEKAAGSEGKEKNQKKRSSYEKKRGGNLTQRGGLTKEGKELRFEGRKRATKQQSQETVNIGARRGKGWRLLVEGTRLAESATIIQKEREGGGRQRFDFPLGRKGKGKRTYLQMCRGTRLALR